MLLKQEETLDEPKAYGNENSSLVVVCNRKWQLFSYILKHFKYFTL